MRLDQEERNITFVPNLGDGGAVNEISDQSMPVRGHGDQVAMLALRGFQDGASGFAAIMARRDP